MLKEKKKNKAKQSKAKQSKAKQSKKKTKASSIQHDIFSPSSSLPIMNCCIFWTPLFEQNHAKPAIVALRDTHVIQAKRGC